MEEITLNAQPRTVTGKQVRHLRRDGLIPAVVYGHRTEPLAVQISERELRHMLLRVGGNQLIRLLVGDGATPRMVLLREVQREPVKRLPLHVDFFEVVMTERIRTEIPVVLVGTSPVVKRGDGLLYRGVESVGVECLPADLISHIEVDASTLAEMDQEITVGSLQLGDKYQILSDPSEVLARVIPVQEEVIEEAAPQAETEVEVVSREKPEEGRGE
ncbi:MAG TPA: 50S ribosomal protein L25 [Anaerolineae bacterium]|nr:50S ribosomal protein L25 [Anaerolineae bacterium]HPL30267.1 50S ribosomal protein L25 [Anaerolineae bacterium]